MNTLIKMSGSLPLEGLYFRSAHIVEQLSRHVLGSVRLESDLATLAPDDFLGKTVCLAFQTQHNASRYIDGVIVEMVQNTQAANSRCSYTVTLASWTWLLGKNQEFRVYQDLSVPEILDEVFARHSHPSVRYESRITRSARKWNYCVQYGESDEAFVFRLLEQEGIYFYFEHALDQHTLVLVDSPSSHQPVAGYSTLQYEHTAPSARISDQERISALGFGKGICTPHHAQADYNFQTPSSSLLAKTQGASRPFNNAYEVFDYPGEHEDVSEGVFYSQVRMQEQLAMQKVLMGTSSARGIAAGHLLTIECSDVPQMAGPHLIVKTTLDVMQAEPESSSSGHSGFSCFFEAIPASQVFRPARITRKALARGPIPALVVGPQGREIFTDEYGRVKVQFYWDRYGQRDEKSSCWVRVAYPVAGKGWGFVAIPRIGQEVVVSFEDGDPDRPLITGVVYNAEQATPYDLPTHQTVSGMRSHSSLNGESTHFNELRFEDDKGKEYVWFQAEKDYFGLIKNDSHEEVGANMHRLIKGNRVEEVQKDVSLKVLGKVSQHIQSGNLTVDDDLLATISGFLGISNQGQVALKTSGQLSVHSDADTQLKTNGNLNFDAACDGHFKAGSHLKISAANSLSLSVGGSCIVISASGIVLNAPSIRINSGGGGGSASGASPVSPYAPAAPAPVVPPQDPLA